MDCKGGNAPAAAPRPAAPQQRSGRDRRSAGAACSGACPARDKAAADLFAAGERSAYAWCRPSGHHAGRGMFGGYCFLNNAALAAQRLRAAGIRVVGLLGGVVMHQPRLCVAVGRMLRALVPARMERA